jgi:hypothetical protein
MSDKYKNGKIYTIRYKNDDPLIYVGSTVQPLFKRWYQHKQILNNKKYNNILLYKNILMIGILSYMKIVLMKVKNN